MYTSLNFSSGDFEMVKRVQSSPHESKKSVFSPAASGSSLFQRLPMSQQQHQQTSTHHNNTSGGNTNNQHRCQLSIGRALAALKASSSSKRLKRLLASSSPLPRVVHHHSNSKDEEKQQQHAAAVFCWNRVASSMRSFRHGSDDAYDEEDDDDDDGNADTARARKVWLSCNPLKLTAHHGKAGQADAESLSKNTASTTVVRPVIRKLPDGKRRRVSSRRRALQKKKKKKHIVKNSPSSSKSVSAAAKATKKTQATKTETRISSLSTRRRPLTNGGLLSSLKKLTRLRKRTLAVVAKNEPGKPSNFLLCRSCCLLQRNLKRFVSSFVDDDVRYEFLVRDVAPLAQAHFSNLLLSDNNAMLLVGTRGGSASSKLQQLLLTQRRCAHVDVAFQPLLLGARVAIESSMLFASGENAEVSAGFTSSISSSFIEGVVVDYSRRSVLYLRSTITVLFPENQLVVVLWVDFRRRPSCSCGAVASSHHQSNSGGDKSRWMVIDKGASVAVVDMLDHDDARKNQRRPDAAMRQSPLRLGIAARYDASKVRFVLQSGGDGKKGNTVYEWVSIPEALL